MLKIRLRRMGAKRQPSYRVVVAEAAAPRDGRFVDIIGHYNPLTNPSTIVIDIDKADKWIRNGAQPTERVAKLLDIVKTGRPAPEPPAMPATSEQPEPVAVATAPPEPVVAEVEEITGDETETKSAE